MHGADGKPLESIKKTNKVAFVERVLSLEIARFGSLSLHTIKSFHVVSNIVR
ncbi:hypothetical protein PAXRUDRAFT_829492 [Paxillus rubicundulus Ve08.2h10]|uniref:Uncharacterized protein n=1 Tax=Paxillus rubicundulus Ve08.2h10 TaxID=930991 RepID=A0A0D0D7V7_9AGAM|nr:hypothetical protein PAXRUDRAFT_829492 [Paxillus rubicundulus Ve08.2h10]